MPTRPTLRRSSLAAVLLLGAAWAQAQPRANADIQARYEQERAVCLSGQSSQDRATCLQEANNARAAAQRGLLESAQNRDYQRNALERCQVFKGEEAQDCRARVLGDAHISGSVGAGGILRERVTIEPAPASDAQ